MTPGERLFLAYERLGFDTEPARQALAEVLSNSTDPVTKKKGFTEDQLRAARLKRRRRSFELRLEELRDDVLRQTHKIQNAFLFDMEDASDRASLQYRHHAFITLATLHHARSLRHAGQVQRSTSTDEASAHYFAAERLAAIREDAAVVRGADPGEP